MEALAQAEYSPSWPVKYRPRIFKDLVGQHEVGLLRHIVNDESCPPVLMFSGSPGVGKTTAARIVASALNCTEKNGKEPCGECDACVAVATGSSYFVTEVDAASFGGAEDMRRLREQTFISVGSNKNIFIIDEAHSISWQGWNVLLKTFEEPVEGVYFILVTSEPSKVPLKIRTRALRFDFTRVPPADIRARLEYIISAEEVDEISPETLDKIVDVSNGSMREAIKLLQTTASCGEFVAKDLSIEFINAVIQNDKPAAMAIASQWWEAVGDLRDIIEMLGSLLEKVYFAKNELPVYCSATTRKSILAIEDSFDDSSWSAVMEVLADWAYRDGTRAHFMFLITQIFKAMYGASKSSSPTPTQETSKDKALGEAEVDSILQGFTL